MSGKAHLKNLHEFPEGSVVRCVYDNRVYVITKHYKNGMCNLFRPLTRTNENWNAYNNRMFVAEGDNHLGILTIILNFTT